MRYFSEPIVNLHRSTHSTRQYAKDPSQDAPTKRIWGIEKMATTPTGEKLDVGELQPNRLASSEKPEVYTDALAKASITSAMQILGCSGSISHFSIDTDDGQ